MALNFTLTDIKNKINDFVDANISKAGQNEDWGRYYVIFLNIIQEALGVLIYPATGRLGQQTVTTAGTQVQLDNTSLVPKNAIWVRALSNNSGIIYVGKTGVTSSNGWGLTAGESHAFTYFGNLNEVYINSTANGDKACYEVS